MVNDIHPEIISRYIAYCRILAYIFYACSHSALLFSCRVLKFRHVAQTDLPMLLCRLICSKAPGGGSGGVPGGFVRAVGGL